MIQNQKQIVVIFFFALLIFVSWQLVAIFSPFLQAFFWAAILSFAFYPLHLAIRKRIGRPVLASLLTTFIVIGVVILPSLFVLINLITQTLEIYQYLSRGGLTQIMDTVRNVGGLQASYERLMHYEWVAAYLRDIPYRMTRVFGDASTAFFATATKNTLLIIFNFCVTLFMIFFMTRDGEKVYKFIYEITPFDDKDRRMIFAKMNDTFASVIRGQFLTSLAQGTLTGLTFLFLGLPAPYFIGFVTFVSSLIPVIGASGVWIPFTLYLLIQQEFTKGITLLVVGTLVISLADNFIKPALIGERIKMPPFLLFFGILGGLRLYGMMGMFLGPLLMTLFYVLVTIYRDKYRPST
jgi:predicted PurR-regulated permease PerM